MTKILPIILRVLIAILLLLLFDRVMDYDARQQCAHPENLGLTIQQHADVCRQAGVIP